MPSDIFDLTGRVAVITGSSRGIGFASAMRMAEHGAKVVISGRKAPACEQAAAQIRAAGGEALAIPCNMDGWRRLHQRPNHRRRRRAQHQFSLSTPLNPPRPA
jgi:NAD(P)-dependent dehydrogenase (short-subunit alcohol dehydrogenase family)